MSELTLVPPKGTNLKIVTGHVTVPAWNASPNYVDIGLGGRPKLIVLGANANLCGATYLGMAISLCDTYSSGTMYLGLNNTEGTTAALTNTGTRITRIGGTSNLTAYYIAFL